MILNYSGNVLGGKKLTADYQLSDNGISLLDLRTLAFQSGLKSRCVRMDMLTLRELDAPCILHILNEHHEEHYLVVFSSKRINSETCFIVGDPARQITTVSETWLNEHWPSRSALYFENLPVSSQIGCLKPIRTLMAVSSLKKTLLFSISVLNIFSTLLGIALSWVLQRGINDPLADKGTRIVLSVILMLSLVTLFKSIITLVRNKILIIVNTEVSRQFNEHFIRKILRESLTGKFSEMRIRKGFKDIQKIQNAMAAFVTSIMSEGTIVACVLAGLWYYEPVCGLINAIYLLLMSAIAFKNTPGLLYGTSRLSELSGHLERSLIKASIQTIRKDNKKEDFNSLLNEYDNLEAATKETANVTGKINFFYEVLGTISVIAVFAFATIKVRSMTIAYSGLMVMVILTYYITALTPRICNAVSVITEGGYLIRRYQNT